MGRGGLGALCCCPVQVVERGEMLERSRLVWCRWGRAGREKDKKCPKKSKKKALKKAKEIVLKGFLF